MGCGQDGSGEGEMGAERYVSGAESTGHNNSELTLYIINGQRTLSYLSASDGRFSQKVENDCQRLRLDMTSKIFRPSLMHLKIALES